MAANTTYDVIVLGAGLVGSAAAYHLAKAGQRVLALEQFEIDHQQGSSFGVSRIIRYAYDHPTYIALAKAVYPMWRALEEEAGTQLMWQTGGLDFGRADEETLLRFRDNLANAGIAHEWLAPAEVAQRFPQFRLDEDMMGLYQADTGLLAASECVKTQVRLAQQHGATVLAGTRVTGVEAQGNSVTVHTAHDRYSAAQLVIAAGAWAGPLLKGLDLRLPLQPTREQLVFFETSDLSQFVPGRFPVFIAHEPTWFYGIPSVDGTGLKVGIHAGSEATDPDHTLRSVDDEFVTLVRGFLRTRIPAGDSPPKSSRVCLYTMTPDEHFILDRHPAYPYIAIGAGFSGHGFKFGILNGRILADLLLAGETPHDISEFRLQRFL